MSEEYSKEASWTGKPEQRTIMRVVLQVGIPNPVNNTVDLLTTEGYIELGKDATPSKVMKLMQEQVNDTVVKVRAHKPSAIIKPAA